MLHGVVELDEDALPGGPLPNPTRSLLLGDPAGGVLVYGCVIDLDNDGEIAGGIRTPQQARVAAAAALRARRDKALGR